MDMIMIFIYMFVPVIAGLLGAVYLSSRYTDKKFNELKQEQQEAGE